MQRADAKQFSDLLAGVFDVYGRQAPKGATLALWWRLLEGFELSAVSAALTRYTATEPKFPPTPAQIREYLGAGSGDARPGPDEAWAIALTSRDESETVIWTPEIAEAFAACRPVLDLGDEVGARMAFKDAYNRIVAAARSRNEPVRWIASLGYDAAKREQALRHAETGGLLPAPQVAALLPPPEPEMSDADAELARQNTARLKAMLADVQARREAEREAAKDAECKRLQALKAEAARKVELYKGLHATVNPAEVH